ncbi:MAG TPA: outer membrane beta-barrel protein [Aquabacterium sp.]|uniref:outer membrane beta-barrel protein n=1 Tax=Aquabacterium sp. TaxID=1872578 RepID=UPI002E2FD8F7|nr:outer membrane beta-barrel protein [Aquabacterium sp.]HEX5356125.1 outer membrane beta-barrel protein [Aquabacterium sp.]
MKQFLMASLLALAATGASAQVEKVYAGGSLGWAKIPTTCAAGETCKDSSVGYKVYVGYDDTAKIAGELGYINFGKSKIDAGAAHAEIKAHAVTVALAFKQQLDAGLKGVLRLGGANVSVKETSNFGFADQGSGWNVYGGVGLEYDIMPGLKAAAALDVTKGGTDGGDSGTLYLLSAGVQYHF